ncbi:MAG TPA: hypothetical protein VNR86_10525 [Sphingomicrobium sp.]|nr:hypothetical protein [Sphingomicrobium sp.]
MSKPSLPACSVKGCSRAADLIIAGSILCATHASRVLASRLASPAGVSR